MTENKPPAAVGAASTSSVGTDTTASANAPQIAASTKTEWGVRASSSAWIALDGPDAEETARRIAASQVPPGTLYARKGGGKWEVQR